MSGLNTILKSGGKSLFFVTCVLMYLPEQAHASAVDQAQASIQAGEAQQLEGVIRKIVINRQPIFDQSVEQNKLAPAVINRLHTVTREHVIKREVWLNPGDRVTKIALAELERNLRALDFFADVSVLTTPTGNKNDAGQDLVDLQISTRDRLSIIFSAGGSFLGGIGEVTFSAGDKNLFGLGHQLQFGYSQNTENELLGSVAYDNVHLYSDDVYGGVQFGRTEEGRFSGFVLEDRFLNFNDPESWKVEGSSETSRVDFFEQGVSIAEVPNTTLKLNIYHLHRHGTALNNWRRGGVFEIKQRQYSEAMGTDTSGIDIPPDSSEVFVGIQLGWERIREFRTLTWVDTLRFKQDVSLGQSIEVLVGANSIVTDTETRTVPLVFLNAWSGTAAGQHDYFNATLSSSAVVGDDNFESWSITTAATWFNTRLRNQTIATRFEYKSAVDVNNLPPQQSLGENNGLRGYPAREFNGEQSVLLNVENRLKTHFNLYSFDIGALAFFDAGWVGDRGESLESITKRAYTSTGLGLRVGSRAILGSGVLRLDIAWPLNESPQRDYEPTVSLAIGQVFGFRP